VVAALIERCGSPLAVTSANTHGLPAPSSFADVEARVLEGVDVAIDAGVTACRDASSIVAVRDGRLQVLREGALTAKKLLTIAGETA
uniref:L-threonylcarbamoyladenylate synthase n=1 Tax=Collinsella sp. D33t1_170424_A12 TaxID=2787135 RepID=UPI00189AA990